MALREILTEPNKILRQKSSIVEKVDKDVQKLMDDMLETMYAAPGIGLAAIQVGVAKRIIVLDIAPKDSPRNPMYFVNLHQPSQRAVIFASKFCLVRLKFVLKPWKYE